MVHCFFHFFVQFGTYFHEAASLRDSNKFNSWQNENSVELTRITKIQHPGLGPVVQSPISANPGLTL